jgi:hypothetical protein
VDILEAFLGAVYRRSFFDADALVARQPPECVTTDDIWFAAHLASRGVPRVKLPMPFDRPVETAADAVSPLRKDNVGGLSKNDVCAAAVLRQLQTWPWREAAPEACGVRLDPLVEPRPRFLEAQFTAR